MTGLLLDLQGDLVWIREACYMCDIECHAKWNEEGDEGARLEFAGCCLLILLYVAFQQRFLRLSIPFSM